MCLETEPSCPFVPTPCKPELTIGLADLSWAGSVPSSDPESGLEVQSQGLLVS